MEHMFDFIMDKVWHLKNMYTKDTGTSPNMVLIGDDEYFALKDNPRFRHYAYVFEQPDNIEILFDMKVKQVRAGSYVGVGQVHDWGMITMGKYRKKPVEIEAFQFYVDAMPDWFMDAVSDNKVILRNCDYNRYSIEEAYCEIKTLEGTMICRGGEYIIKGVAGELYPCKPDIFEKTYENVEE